MTTEGIKQKGKVTYRWTFTPEDPIIRDVARMEDGLLYVWMHDHWTLVNDILRSPTFLSINIVMEPNTEGEKKDAEQAS